MISCSKLFRFRGATVLIQLNKDTLQSEWTTAVVSALYIVVLKSERRKSRMLHGTCRNCTEFRSAHRALPTLYARSVDCGRNSSFSRVSLRSGNVDEKGAILKRGGSKKVRLGRKKPQPSNSH